MKTNYLSKNPFQILSLPTDEMISEVELRNRELLRTMADRRKLNIYVYSGNVWVTQEGDPEDHFLKSGDAFVADRRGLVIMQAQPAARVRVSRHD